jgi:rhodanese-related sulfurtransferase
MDHRTVKDRLYAVWADTAKALASPKRVELLDLLAQGERTVEALAREATISVNNTSSHLTVLKGARLVESRKEAQFVFYRLADDSVSALLQHVQAFTRRRLHEVDHLVRTYIEQRDALEPVGVPELQRRLRRGDVTVIDVRPAVEYLAGHVPGALSMPLETLSTRLGELPKHRPVVAYCRGPYCVMAYDAVERLRKRGYEARRLADGLPAWRLAGHPVAAGADAGRVAPRRRSPANATRRTP